MSIQPETPFEMYPVYAASDLGLTYAPDESTFKVWAPSASSLKIKLYDSGAGGKLLQEKKMSQADQGVWEISFEEDLKGVFYAFQAKVAGKWLNEVVDPYARAVGINGDRGQVVNLEETHPQGWNFDKGPKLNQPTDAIIYELHVRDISMHENSGIYQKGKFLGLVEPNSQSPQGLSTGIDHIKQLGITHVHLLPSFDFRSIDESRLEENQYNWGYDPKNYNVPEGSFSSDPTDGATRIREFKEMVQAFHDNGIGVILDVVYNHTGETETSNFNQLVPGYYYRQNPDGTFSNASACGNETASDRLMMRKFIVESIQYWLEEYHLDGFRFDLMGIHDIETMNAISQAARAINPDVLIYGEGWTAGDSPLPLAQRALKAHTYQLEGIAAFSDDIRDGLKGHVFTHDAPGFASGKTGLKESVKFGIVASGWHPQIDYNAVNYSDAAWAKSPGQTVTYVSCHDNHTLWDKIQISRKDASIEQQMNMHKLALATVLTSQGISFLHAGTEMLRTKQGVENSFESPDAINSIDWSRKSVHSDIVEYVQGLIRLRKSHPAFRMNDAAQIREHLTFLPTGKDQVIAYQLGPHANKDPWTNIIVVLNGSDKGTSVTIPRAKYIQIANGEKVNLKGLEEFTSDRVFVDSYSVSIIYTETISATK
jgi:pullulanase